MSKVTSLENIIENQYGDKY
uniref:Uncharacterized protein n=1 Tax=Heterorhabditis bacteriophora TaxID=37862 RepID=A0A1I7WQ73_HETBA